MSITMPSVALSAVSFNGGVAFNTTVGVNGTANNVARPTAITSITSRYDNDVNADGSYDDPAGEYGAGNTLYFDVTFNDEVVWATGSTTYPKLWLNIGQWALYSSGFETETLTFSYALTENDNTNALLPQDLTDGTGTTQSPIYCISADLCHIYNRNNRPVSLAPGAIVDPLIVVDTAKPTVVAVWTNKST